MKEYDIILIGTGQATGTLIQEFLKKKLSVAVVEENRVGGSCVNWGCTPTKTLIGRCPGGTHGPAIEGFRHRGFRHENRFSESDGAG